MLDASVAFVLILILAQLCLLWLSLFVGQRPLIEGAERQKHLIEASDRLINDPACLAATKGNSVVPQTIVARNLSESELAYCCDGCGYGINASQGGIRRLVFVGGGPAVLSVW